MGLFLLSSFKCSSPGFCFSAGRMCDRIICAHHPRSLIHNSTMTSADGICLLLSVTHPSNLQPKDTGHRPCQSGMMDSSSHELRLNQQIAFEKAFSFLPMPYLYSLATPFLQLLSVLLVSLFLPYTLFFPFLSFA